MKSTIENAAIVRKRLFFVSPSPKGRGLALNFLINPVAVGAASLWHPRQVVQRNFVRDETAIQRSAANPGACNRPAQPNQHPKQVT
jgi:hypothetical protein